MLPRGYGVAWNDPMRCVSVCYPIPFHRLFGWVRRWYWDLIAPPCSPHSDRLKSQVANLERRLRVAEDHAKALLGELSLYKKRDLEREAATREWIRSVRQRGEIPEA